MSFVPIPSARERRSRAGRTARSRLTFARTQGAQRVRLSSALRRVSWRDLRPVPSLQRSRPGSGSGPRPGAACRSRRTGRRCRRRRRCRRTHRCRRRPHCLQGAIASAAQWSQGDLQVSGAGVLIDFSLHCRRRAGACTSHAAGLAFLFSAKWGSVVSFRTAARHLLRPMRIARLDVWGRHGTRRDQYSRHLRYGHHSTVAARPGVESWNGPPPDRMGTRGGGPACLSCLRSFRAAIAGRHAPGSKSTLGRGAPAAAVETGARRVRYGDCGERRSAALLREAAGQTASCNRNCALTRRRSACGDASAAVAFLDVAGYSRLMGADEEATFLRWVALRRGLIEPRLKKWRGRVADRAGDGLLVEFQSVLDALRWAVEVQAALGADATEASLMQVRIALHLGNVIEGAGSSIHGDDVNIAARLQAYADPGAIILSKAVADEVAGKVRGAARGPRRAAPAQHRAARPRLQAAGERGGRTTASGTATTPGPRPFDRGVALPPCAGARRSRATSPMASSRRSSGRWRSSRSCS